jgi:hypothetical protein
MAGWLADFSNELLELEQPFIPKMRPLSGIFIPFVMADISAGRD